MIDNEKKDFVEEISEDNDKDFLDTINDDEEDEIVDLTSEKINELNKKLPSWSIEPPHKYLDK